MRVSSAYLSPNNKIASERPGAGRWRQRGARAATPAPRTTATSPVNVWPWNSGASAVQWECIGICDCIKECAVNSDSFLVSLPRKTVANRFNCDSVYILKVTAGGTAIRIPDYIVFMFIIELLWLFCFGVECTKAGLLAEHVDAFCPELQFIAETK